LFVERDAISRLSNYDLLLDYGFLISGNRYNLFEFAIEFDQKDPLFPAKEKFLVDEHQIKGNTVIVNFHGTMPINYLFINRVAALNETEMSKIANCFTTSKNPISKEHELRTYQRILKYLEGELSAYNTTSQTDEDILDVGSINRRVEDAITIRLEEKYLLIHHINFIKNQIVSDIRTNEYNPNEVKKETAKETTKQKNEKKPKDEL